MLSQIHFNRRPRRTRTDVLYYRPVLSQLQALRTIADKSEDMNHSPTVQRPPLSGSARQRRAEASALVQYKNSLPNRGGTTIPRVSLGRRGEPRRIGQNPPPFVRLFGALSVVGRRRTRRREAKEMDQPARQRSVQRKTIEREKERKRGGGGLKTDSPPSAIFFALVSLLLFLPNANRNKTKEKNRPFPLTPPEDMRASENPTPFRKTLAPFSLFLRNVSVFASPSALIYAKVPLSR